MILSSKLYSSAGEKEEKVGGAAFKLMMLDVFVRRLIMRERFYGFIG